MVAGQADRIVTLVQWGVATLAAGGKILFMGNGGSAADAQHLAAEFVNRFLLARPPLAALALTTDSSVLTSIGNDFGFEQVFAKQIQALGRPGDLAIAISTSGGSANVLLALQVARGMGLRTVAWAGGDGGAVAAAADLALVVPSRQTPHIQETHAWLGHLFCQLVEEELFCGPAAGRPA
ncbi:MAG: SIS domain-containing protein [Thermodesulfobacteriota bacterium]